MPAKARQQSGNGHRDGIEESLGHVPRSGSRIPLTGVWLRLDGKDWMNPLDREARLKPAAEGMLFGAGSHGLKPVSIDGAV